MNVGRHTQRAADRASWSYLKGVTETLDRLCCAHESRLQCCLLSLAMTRGFQETLRHDKCLGDRDAGFTGFRKELPVLFQWRRAIRPRNGMKAGTTAKGRNGSRGTQGERPYPKRLGQREMSRTLLHMR